jgi:hypothetical protein
MKLYFVYYKSILTGNHKSPGAAAVFFRWKEAQEYASSMNEFSQGYFVAEGNVKIKKEKV